MWLYLTHDTSDVRFCTAGRSEIRRETCFVSSYYCVFSPGLLLSGASINWPHCKKSQRFLQKKSKACFTLLVSWRLTWTGNVFCVQISNIRLHLHISHQICALLYSNFRWIFNFQVCGQNAVPALSSQCRGHGWSRKALLLFTFS